MHIAVTGSRHFVNEQQVRDVLDQLLADCGRLSVAHGKSKGGGVDAFVAKWCFDNRSVVDEWPYPVKPDLDGRHKGAPLKRNERMICGFMPHKVIGFRAEGKSNGTDHTLHFARRMGIPTEVHNET
jgi:hypothetical protein